MPPGAEGVDAGSRVGGRSPRAPVRRRAQGGSRWKTVVRWSGATSRQCKRFQRETQARRGRATREPTSQNVGSARGAIAPRTLRTRACPHLLGGRRSGLGAIATADVKARWRQPKKTPAAGGHRSPVARQPLGGRERSKRGRSGRGNGAPRDHEHGELGPRASQRDSRCAPAKGAVQAAAELTPAGGSPRQTKPHHDGRGAAATTPTDSHKHGATPTRRAIVGQSSGGRRGCLSASERK